MNNEFKNFMAMDFFFNCPQCGEVIAGETNSPIVDTQNGKTFYACPHCELRAFSITDSSKLSYDNYIYDDDTSIYAFLNHSKDKATPAYKCNFCEQWVDDDPLGEMCEDCKSAADERRDRERIYRRKYYE